ncbi:CDP-alcohol phosphatidyltransferase family protein [Polyangium fumosum]|nr:CDP-alcohol phosphatidyltransferase family protein [Polyangium fumosum]
MRPSHRSAFFACAVTTLGLASSLLWLGGVLPWWAGLFGLLCDAADGEIARRSGGVTTFGALYDWSADLVLCALGWAHLGGTFSPASLVLLAFLVPVQVALHLKQVHFSGRTGVFVAGILLEVFGP